MKRFFQGATVVLILAILVATADSLYFAYSREDAFYRLMPGMSRHMVGELVAPIDDVYLMSNKRNRVRAEATNDFLRRLLRFRCDSPNIQMDFLEVNGKTWQGVLSVGKTAEPGRFAYTVCRKNDPVDDLPVSGVIGIYPDRATYLASFRSVIERETGYKPWWMIIVSAPLTVLCLLMVNHYTAREEAALIARGIGPVYKLIKRRNGWEIKFGLGRKHDVLSGDVLPILDGSMRPVCEVYVTKAGNETSQGTVDAGADLSTLQYVSRRNPQDPLPAIGTPHRCQSKQ